MAKKMIKEHKKKLEHPDMEKGIKMHHAPKHHGIPKKHMSRGK